MFLKTGRISRRGHEKRKGGGGGGRGYTVTQ